MSSSAKLKTKATTEANATRYVGFCSENFAEKYHNMKLNRVNVIVLMKKPVPIPKNPRNTIITNPRKGPNPK